MRLVALAAISALAGSSLLFARLRNAPREVVVRAEARGGILCVHGEVSPPRLSILAPELRMYSTAPDGDLTIRRLAAHDADGSEVSVSQAVAPTRATTLVIAPSAGRFDAEVDLDCVDSGNTAVGYASQDGDAVALPIRRFLFGAESNRTRVVVDAAENSLLAPDLLARGLFVAGRGWRRESTDCLDMICGPNVPESIGRHVEGIVRRAQSHLASARFPPPQIRPVVLVVDETRDDAFAHFDLPPESEVYVVQCRRGGVLLESGVFRDLASAAVARYSSIRPSAERLLWISLEGELAIELGIAEGLPTAREQARAARRGYEASDHLLYSPMATPNIEPTLYWFVRECVAVHLWDLFFESLEPKAMDSWATWTSRVAKEPKRGVEDLTRDAFGEQIAARFHELMTVGGWHVPRAAAPQTPSQFPAASASLVDPSAPSESPEDLQFVFTAMNLGFLDNCGCAKNQGGGVARRKCVVDRQRERHPDAIVLDLGDTLSPPLSKKSRDVKANETLLSVLSVMRYDGLVPGIAELAHDATWLHDKAAANGLIYFAANVRDRRAGAAFPPTITVRRGGRTVHILGLVEVPYERYYVPAIEARVFPQYELDDAFECAHRVLAAAAKDEVWCIAGTVTPETTQRLLASDVADRIDAVLTCSWRVGRLLNEDSASGKRTYLRVPAEGLYGRTAYVYSEFERYAVSVARLGFDGAGRVDRVATEVVDMPASVEQDKGVEQVLARYAAEEAGDRATWPTTPVSQLPEEQRLAAGYVGVEACAPCHTKETESWQRTRHSHAVNALASKGKEHDVSCLRCHTTGFHWRDGFDPTAETRQQLEHVQCEVCHGPGREHVRNRAEKNSNVSDAIRRVPTRAVCTSCHDEMNSPSFHFEYAIERVHH